MPIFEKALNGTDSGTDLNETAYPLSTPCAVSLPWQPWNSYWDSWLNAQWMFFWRGDPDPLSMTLTYEVDLDILPLDLHTKIQVWPGEWDGQSLSQTDTMPLKLSHHPLTKGVKRISDLGNFTLSVYGPIFHAYRRAVPIFDVRLLFDAASSFSK